MIHNVEDTYKCEHCKKKLFRKHAMELHEKLCTYNPENKRACFNCTNLTKKETVIYFDSYHGELERKVDILFCSEKEIFLYTPKNEIKKNFFELGDDSNEPMPRDCESQNKHFTPSENTNITSW